MNPEKSDFARFLEQPTNPVVDEEESEFAKFLKEGQPETAQTDLERQREIARGAVNLYRPANKDFAESRDIHLRQKGKRITGPEALVVRGGNAVGLGLPAIFDKNSKEAVRIAGEDQPGMALTGDVLGFAAGGGNVIADAGMKMIPKSGIPKFLGLGAVGAAENAAFQSTVGESNQFAAGQSSGSLGERAGAFADGASDPLAWLGGPAAYGLGRMTGLIKEPLNDNALALAEILEARSGTRINPDDLRVFERFLRDKGVTLDGESLGHLGNLQDEASELGPSGVLSSGLPVRLKDALPEVLNGNKETLKNSIRSQLRGTTLLGGDESAEIIRKSVNEDLPASREFLSEGLRDTLGNKSRLQAQDDINSQLTQIGREGYEPLLNAPVSDEARQALDKVLSGPGMNKLYEPLRTVAAGEGLNLDSMLKAQPMRAAHWMQSKARQLADRSSDAVMSNAMGALRQRLLNGLNEASGGQYDIVRKQYGDEFGNLQALEFGDRFLTKANKDLDIDLMAREFEELSPTQKEAAMLSVRDALQSSTGRGTAINGPRLTKVKEEQVLTALPKVFGETGNDLARIIQQTSDFVDDRKFVGRFGSDTASNQSMKEMALESVQPKWRRRLGQVVSDAGSDAGLSAFFGSPVPFQTIQRQTKNLGNLISGNPEGKLASIARVLEAPIQPIPNNALGVPQQRLSPPRSAAPSGQVPQGPTIPTAAAPSPAEAVAASRGILGNQRGSVVINNGKNRRQTQNDIRDGLKEAGGRSRAPVSIETGEPIAGLPESLQRTAAATTPIPGVQPSYRGDVTPAQARGQLREDLISAGDNEAQVDQLLEILGDDVVQVLRDRQLGPAVSRGIDGNAGDGGEGLGILLGLLGAGGAATAIQMAMRDSGNTKATMQDVMRALDRASRQSRGLPPTPQIKPPLNLQ